jgi:DNA-binding response OmpR family regulator
MMPYTDGLDLCRRVRALKREDYTYFILLTSASRSHENIHAAVDAGVDDFLTKPINPDDMWMRLRVASRIISFAGQVRELERLLPICAYCKKVRNDANLWEAVETYLTEHTGMDLSHSICPECYRKFVQTEIDELKRGE